MAISFIGSAVQSAAGNAASMIVTLPGSMLVNDLIVISAGVGDTANNGLAAPTEGGYTAVTSTLYSNDVNDTNLDVFYKFHNGTDTTATFTPVGGANGANAAVCMVFRGVMLAAQGGPFFTTSTTATAINTSNADPPAIATADNVAVVICASTGHTGGAGATYTNPTNYTADAAFRAHDDTIDVLVGMGFRLSGYANPENPGVFTAATIGTATDNAWAAITIALRAASPNVNSVSTIKIPSKYVGPPALRRAFRQPVWPQATFFGLVGWYDATQITFNDGDPMSQWDDESGFENHALQVTAARRPVYKTGIFAGGTKPGILIDATGADPSYFSMPNPIRSVISEARSTVIIVWKWFTAPPGGASARFFNAVSPPSQSASMEFRCDGSTPANANTIYYNGSTNVGLGTNDDTNINGHVYARTDSGVNIAFQYDSNTPETASDLVQHIPDLSVESRAAFGSTSITASPSKGYLAEIQIWNYALTSVDVQTQVDALTAKWLTAPTITAQYFLTMGVGH